MKSGWPCLCRGLRAGAVALGAAALLLASGCEDLASGSFLGSETVTTSRSEVYVSPNTRLQVTRSRPGGRVSPRRVYYDGVRDLYIAHWPDGSRTVHRDLDFLYRTEWVEDGFTIEAGPDAPSRATYKSTRRETGSGLGGIIIIDGSGDDDGRSGRRFPRRPRHDRDGKDHHDHHDRYDRYERCPVHDCDRDRCGRVH